MYIMLYHGSKYHIKGYLVPHGSKVINGEKAVFATNSLIFSLLFGGRSFSDNEMEIGTQNKGRLTIIEKKREVFKKIYDKKSCYVYSVSNRGFKKDKRLGMPKYEMISRHKIKFRKWRY